MDETKKMHATCPQCGNKFKFDPEDSTVISDFQKGFVRYVTCPACSKFFHRTA